MSGYMPIKGRTILSLVASTRGALAAVCTTIHSASDSAAPLPPARRPHSNGLLAAHIYHSRWWRGHSPCLSSPATLGWSGLNRLAGDLDAQRCPFTLEPFLRLPLHPRALVSIGCRARTDCRARIVCLCSPPVQPPRRGWQPLRSHRCVRRGAAAAVDGSRS